MSDSITRNPYPPVRTNNAQVPRTPQPTGGPSKTKQSEDPGGGQTLMERWLKTGLVRQRTDEATYGDFSNVGDYREAKARVQQAQEDFLQLPPRIREHVHNDPAELLELVTDPDRHQELVDLGMTDQQVDQVLPQTRPPETPTPETPATPETPETEPTG